MLSYTFVFFFIEPDRTRANFAQDGPIISYKTDEDSIMVKSIFPVSLGKILFPKIAKPIETPACGIRAKPK